jgi:hypothetical protein
MIKPFMPPEIAEAASHIQHFWMKMIADGQSERFATMAALQQPPGTKGTDRAFLEGKNNQEWLDDMPKRQADYILREAKQAGIATAGKVYMSGLADKRGWTDPEAWISDVSDIKRVAKKRNLQVRGIVDVESQEVEPTRPDLNPRIARSLAKKEIAKNPSLSMKQALEKVKAKHVPHWRKKRA